MAPTSGDVGGIREDLMGSIRDMGRRYGAGKTVLYVARARGIAVNAAM